MKRPISRAASRRRSPACPGCPLGGAPRYRREGDFLYARFAKLIAAAAGLVRFRDGGPFCKREWSVLDTGVTKITLHNETRRPCSQRNKAVPADQSLSQPPT